MRQPVDNFDKWYIAQGFGVKTTYGFHEGADYNLKTGGDSDLGAPLFSIANGEVVLVHEHTNTPSFGKHLFIKHQGPWGVVYSHYAHTSAIHVSVGDKVTEGQKVASVGKTGTELAHCHFCIVKNISNPDAIATTKEQLSNWIDPLEFIKQWSGEVMDCSDIQKALDAEKKDNAENRQRIDDARRERDDALKENERLRDELKKTKDDFKLERESLTEQNKLEKERYKAFVAAIAEVLGSVQDEPVIKAELNRLVGVEDVLRGERAKHEDTKVELSKARDVVDGLNREILSLKEQLKTAKGLKDASRIELLTALIDSLLKIKRG